MMVQTLNKHLKWRKDKSDILVCDCKNRIDLKLPFQDEQILRTFEKGIDENKLKDREKKLFEDFKKLDLVVGLEIRGIKEKEFNNAMKILDNELKKRVRDDDFLKGKFKVSPEFFKGIFLDDEIVGIICGFERDDYLLISELAVDSRFQRRGFGKMLVETFIEEAKDRYAKIHVGADDDALDFYSSLGFVPFLLIQYKNSDYSRNDFSDFEILKESEVDDQKMLEVKAENIDKQNLLKYKEKYPLAGFQYIFVKLFEKPKL